MVLVPQSSLDQALAQAVESHLHGRIEDLSLLDTPAAAKLLDLDPRAFLALAKDEGIRPVSFGPRRTRWTMADLRRLIESHRVKL